jgi:hypothetical protein
MTSECAEPTNKTTIGNTQVKNALASASLIMGLVHKTMAEALPLAQLARVAAVALRPESLAELFAPYQEWFGYELLPLS